MTEYTPSGFNRYRIPCDLFITARSPEEASDVLRDFFYKGDNRYGYLDVGVNGQIDHPSADLSFYPDFNTNLECSTEGEGDTIYPSWALGWVKDRAGQTTT